MFQIVLSETHFLMWKYLMDYREHICKIYFRLYNL